MIGTKAAVFTGSLRVTFTGTGRRSSEVFDDLLAATGWRPVSATRLLLKSGAFAISASLPQVAPRKKQTSVVI
jgi:hypothetical protein